MIITETPLRVSFAGGGTDFEYYYREHGGYAVSAAIDKAVYVIVTGRFDDKIYIHYSRREIVDSVDEIQNCIVREAMRITGVERGVEIVLMADIPTQGTGLGSSSSFAVGVLNALHTFKGEQVSAEQLALEACDIEIARCGSPIGKQDQYIAAHGGLAGLSFNKDGSVSVERFRLTQKDLQAFASTLVLVYSGITREANTILSSQRDRYEDNLRRLDAIKALAHRAGKALAERHFEHLGPILSENWQIKRGLAPGISLDEIEDLNRRNMKAGAYGGKLCGAGGGGFWLAQCAPERVHDIQKEFSDKRVFPVRIRPHGSRVILNYPRS